MKKIRKALKCIRFFEKEIEEVLPDYEKCLFIIRICFLRLSKILKNLKSTKETKDKGIHKMAISDTLYFYSFTYTFFKYPELTSNTGEKVQIRSCDVSNITSYIQEGENVN